MQLVISAHTKYNHFLLWEYDIYNCIVHRVPRYWKLKTSCKTFCHFCGNHTYLTVNVTYLWIFIFCCRKHSSGDLHSRLKTRKLLGVGETDDGDVHRSKVKGFCFLYHNFISSGPLAKTAKCQFLRLYQLLSLLTLRCRNLVLIDLCLWSMGWYDLIWD